MLGDFFYCWTYCTLSRFHLLLIFFSFILFSYFFRQAPLSHNFLCNETISTISLTILILQNKIFIGCQSGLTLFTDRRWVYLVSLNNCSINSAKCPFMTPYASCLNYSHINSNTLHKLWLRMYSSVNINIYSLCLSMWLKFSDCLHKSQSFSDLHVNCTLYQRHNTLDVHAESLVISVYLIQYVQVNWKMDTLSMTITAFTVFLIPVHWNNLYNTQLTALKRNNLEHFTLNFTHWDLCLTIEEEITYFASTN